ncbi:hypothetical protein Nmel_008477 [Mimus melanotis]
MRGRAGKVQHMQLSVFCFLNLCGFVRLPSNANNRLIL